MVLLVDFYWDYYKETKQMVRHLDFGIDQKINVEVFDLEKLGIEFVHFLVQVQMKVQKKVQKEFSLELLVHHVK